MKQALMTICLGMGAGAVSAGEYQLGWLEGRWCRVAGETSMEEFWFAPSGSGSVGVSRTLRDGRMVAFEYLRIVLREGEAVYLASPDGRPPTEFAATGHGADWITFENPQHDFPQRIAYRREGDGLLAEISGPGSGGETQIIGFQFSSCR